MKLRTRFSALLLALSLLSLALAPRLLKREAKTTQEIAELEEKA